MANLLLTQKDISGKASTKTDEATVLKLAEFAKGRKSEITFESRGESLATFRLARELGQMQAHIARHGAMPTGESLKNIQEKVKTETQEMKAAMVQEQQAQQQQEQVVRQGLRM